MELYDHQTSIGKRKRAARSAAREMWGLSKYQGDTLPKVRALQAAQKGQSMKTNRQYQGYLSRENGKAFEDLIELSCLGYLNKGIACIEKTPEPIKVLSKVEGNGTFHACFEKHAQPDYKGVLNNGRAIVFEAKHTDKDRIEKSAVKDWQGEALKTYSKMGALTFILVSFGFTKFYAIPWEVWDGMKEDYGRKYLTPADISRFEVKLQNYLRFLDIFPVTVVTRAYIHERVPHETYE